MGCLTGGSAGGMSGIARAALEWGMARLHDGEWKRPAGGGETGVGKARSVVLGKDDGGDCPAGIAGAARDDVGDAVGDLEELLGREGLHGVVSRAVAGTTSAGERSAVIGKHDGDRGPALGDAETVVADADDGADLRGFGGDVEPGGAAPARVLDQLCQGVRDGGIEDSGDPVDGAVMDARPDGMQPIRHQAVETLGSFPETIAHARKRKMSTTEQSLKRCQSRLALEAFPEVWCQLPPFLSLPYLEQFRSPFFSHTNAQIALEYRALEIPSSNRC